jgi:hypothetical protein
MVRASAKTFLENEPPENLSVRNDQMGSGEAPPIVWAVRVPGQTPGSLYRIAFTIRPSWLRPAARPSRYKVHR